jgi:hypothetical protein
MARTSLFFCSFCFIIEDGTCQQNETAELVTE